MDRSHWIRTCPICGAQFTNPRWGAKYCSDECRKVVERRRDAERRKRRAALNESRKPSKICPKCGKEFKPRHPLTIYCPECVRERLDEMVKRVRESGPKTRLCDTCGKEFVASHSGIIDCPECRAMHSIRSAILPPTRRCTSCGKPCSNYRCDECWAALRKKLGIAVDLEDEDDMEDLS